MCPSANLDCLPLITSSDLMETVCSLAAIYNANQQQCDKITFATPQQDTFPFLLSWLASVLTKGQDLIQHVKFLVQDSLHKNCKQNVWMTICMLLYCVFCLDLVKIC